MQQVTHPTKEQVRAYMYRREVAQRPPPSPEEIRRQLDWHIACGGELPVMSHYIDFLPGKISQLSTLLALEWLFRISRPIGWPSYRERR